MKGRVLAAIAVLVAEAARKVLGVEIPVEDLETTIEVLVLLVSAALAALSLRKPKDVGEGK